MANPKTIYTYEYGTLQVDGIYNGNEFRQIHFDLLAKYLTVNPKCKFYSLLHKRVKFCNYVGVIKVGDITIEVLPKTDKHEETEEVWQSVLLNMLAISLQVEAKTTTHADIQIKRNSVLETYIQLFLDEAKTIIHHGLVKKYRRNISNQTSLKGKLMIHQHVSKNLVHLERFYVSHTVYDRDNIYNFILLETLHCIQTLNVSASISKSCASMLIDFPECRPFNISEKLFEKLTFDRKTERYKTAISLARIILLNYHPDVKGGSNNVLAIMFDMNLLWENYVYWIIKKCARRLDYKVTLTAQSKALFWQHPDDWNLRLKPDLLIDIAKDGITKSFILDTKWKYKSDTSVEDVRQMYAYSQYFLREVSYLLYPDKLENNRVTLREGFFYQPSTEDHSDIKCGIGFLDIINDKKLNISLGDTIVETLFHFDPNQNRQRR